MGVIGLDTMNMDPKIAKGTARDLAVYEDLQRRVRVGGVISDPTAFYNKLVSAKTDISYWMQLLPQDAIRLDYKNFETTNSSIRNGQGKQGIFGMASVLLPAFELLSKPGFADAALDTIKQQAIDYLAVMSFVSQPATQREIAILALDANVLDRVCATLSSGDPPLALSLIEHPATQFLHEHGLYVKLFSQGNIKASRKQVAPILQQQL
jgi:exopolyphosphatase